MGTATQGELNMLKWISSLSTLACIVAIIRIYWLHILLHRVMQHVHKLSDMITGHTVREIFSSFWLWTEIIVVVMHCPPYFEYSFGSTIMGNYVVYEVETILANVTFLRIYLVWRAIQDWFLSDLPNRHTLSGFNSVELDSAFVIKRMLHDDRTLYYLFLVWIFVILIFAYWYRSAELTACLFPEIQGRTHHKNCSLRNALVWTIQDSEFEKVNDTFFQNACWHILVTATTVGYGENRVTTHFGRLVSILVGVVGMVMVSTTTACLCNLLEWSQEEETANTGISQCVLLVTAQITSLSLLMVSLIFMKTLSAVINREAKRTAMLRVAATIIGRWWKDVKEARFVAERFGRTISTNFKQKARMHMTASRSVKNQSFITQVKTAYKGKNDVKFLRSLKSELTNEELDDFQGMSDKVILYLSISLPRAQDLRQ
jgi:hypothetical protein